MSTSVIAGALVCDGTGAPASRSDVVIGEGRILDVVPAGRGTGRRVDADGLVLAPGFVDLHAHSDLTRIAYPSGDTRILQGITTEVIGNCGLSPAPVARDDAGFRESIATIDVAPDVTIDWSSPAEYLEALDGMPAAWNVAPLLGHGGVRRAVMGESAEAASPQERAAMATIVEDALVAGYWGLSLGLMYAPGELSDRAELVELARVVAAHDALLAAHMRAYDGRGLADAVREILDITQSSGAALEISHLRSIADPDGTGLDEALRLIGAASADVAADAYPYLAGHTTALQLLPPELRARGTGEILHAIGADRDTVARTIRVAAMFPPESITIARAGEGAAPEVGRTLAELAPLDPGAGDWASVLVDLIARHEGAVDAIVVGTRPQDAARVLREPYVSVASDGVALSLSHTANLPHPRSIGTFPRAFRDLLDAGVSLEQTVRKMTDAPARRVGVDRGRIALGAAADLVLLDVDTLNDNARYDAALLPPSGIRGVWVAGEMVADEGRITGRMPGRLLRRNR